MKKVAAGLAGLAALFPGADILAKVIPTPNAFSLLVKVPTALACVLIVVTAPSVRPRRAVWCVIGGIVSGVMYLAFAYLYLHHDPINQPDGDYAVVGLWLEPSAQKQLNDGMSKEELWRRNPPPVEWNGIYSTESQLATSSVCALMYIATFGLLTLGFRSLARKTASAEGRRKASGRAKVGDPA